MKEKEITNSVIVAIEKYGIIFASRNFIVAEKNSVKKNTDVRSEDFDSNSYTYHISISQALEQLSKRMLEEKIKSKTTDRPLNLKELTDLFKEHHNYFVSISRGN
jgi:hypothetical protein